MRLRHSIRWSTGHLRNLGHRATRNRPAAVTVVAAAILATVAGCSAIGGHGTVTVSGTAGPADAGQSSQPSTAAQPPTASSTTQVATSTTSGSGSTSSGNGCPPGGAAVPAGAGTAQTADLDGDGRSDTIWLADRGSIRMLGVRTASGARFSTTFTSAAPQSAAAVAGRLGDGTAVILLDLSRKAALYAVVDCAIVPSRNAQGAQYAFDEGFTGYGTGAGCPVIGTSGRHLVGYRATSDSKGTAFKVTRTTITLSNHGSRATNGATTTLGTRLPTDSATVREAQAVTCGNGHTALEPQS